MFSTLARILPSLCPIPGKSGLPPTPDEGLGDFVGSQAVAGSDQDKEKSGNFYFSGHRWSGPAGDQQ